MVVRRWTIACAVALLGGCGWTVPPPHVLTDAASDLPEPHTDATADVPSVDAHEAGGDTGLHADATGADAVDASTPDDFPVATDGGVDATVADTTIDVGGMDVSPADVTTADVLVDVPTVMDEECMPGDTRACYDGALASENVGACRDGVLTCDAMGQWSACVGEIVPDCVNRVCGSDECGGSCGTCATGTVCNDAGQCVALACGMSQFVVECPDGTTCPTGSTCAAGGNCACQAGYIAVDCNGDACAPCTYPDWVCVPSPFCGAGEVICASGAHCPRHSGCDPVSGACLCNTGYTATTCGGTHCTSCPGTDYECAPLPAPM